MVQKNKIWENKKNKFNQKIIVFFFFLKDTVFDYYCYHQLCHCFFFFWLYFLFNFDIFILFCLFVLFLVFWTFPLKDELINLTFLDLIWGIGLDHFTHLQTPCCLVVFFFFLNERGERGINSSFMTVIE